MNHLKRASFLAFLSALTVSCSPNNNNPEAPLEGVWYLTAWNIDQSVDIDHDGAGHVNLLEEVACENNETLEFDSSGIAAFNNTFNPNIKITALNSAMETLDFNVMCDAGVLGSASSYSKNGNSLIIGNISATINGNDITIIQKNKLQVFNADMSQVMSNKDVVKVYTKL